MDNKKSPLLSIVIPTKNRQYTCLYVIETCLLIKNNDIEIIVQDCSDSNILQKQITNKFENDSRILYQFDGTKPSMTDNWNKGYENSSGKYIIGIGDDDGILPEIYEIANWADRHSFEVVGHTEPYNYLWPDYPIKHYQGSLIARNFNSSIQYIDDLKARVKLRSKYADMGYAIDLPMVYHRLISRTLYEKIKTVTGKFLDGTSLDVYTSFTIGLIAKKFIMIDYPFSFRGACNSSNSGRVVDKKDQEHFNEFLNVDYPAWMPNIKVVHVSIAESIHKAFKNTNNEKLLENLSLPYLYAVCILARSSTAIKIFKLAFKYFTTARQWMELFKFLLIKFYSVKLKSILPFIAQKLNPIVPIYSLYRNHLIKSKKIILLNNSIEVVKYHQKLLKKSGISLNLVNDHLDI